MKNLSEYFDKLDLMGIQLTDGQKLWYQKKSELLKDDMAREYPSFPDEAFQASQVGNWYASQMKELRDNGHFTRVSYDKTQSVNCSFDLGQRDATAIWFFQINRVGEIMLIDYFEKTDCPLHEVAQVLNSKGYTYGTHIFPHDARARDRAGITFETQALEYGISGIVLEQAGLLDGINLVRTTLSKCFFDQVKCKEGIQALQNYKKKWNNQIGGYTAQPLHDNASNGADSFRYLCSGYRLLSDSGSMENDYNALRKFWGG